MTITLKPALRVGHGRCAEPSETVARLESALGKNCEYTGNRVSESLYWGTLSVDGLGLQPMGKGTSSLLCKASTYAEAIEWLALQRRRKLPGHIETHQDKLSSPLKIEDLVAQVAPTSDDMAEKIKNVDLAQHWVDGTSLFSGKTLNVPLEYVNAISGTNGLAAGNCIEEAIVQGINEVFERRSVITVVKNRMVVPTIDIESIDNSVILDQIQTIKDLGINVIIKDLSFGGALPCVGLYFNDPAIPADLQTHHAFKAAAAWDREAAVMSCLTEYVQLRRLNEASADRPHEQLVCEPDDTDNFLTLFWFGYIPSETAGYLEEGDVVPFDKGEIFDDCLQEIERSKIICDSIDRDLIVVELTDQNVGFPIVQVVIPGYSDILPYHPKSSTVLFKGWTRDLVLGYCKGENGPEPCSAHSMFPEW